MSLAAAASARPCLGRCAAPTAAARAHRVRSLRTAKTRRGPPCSHSHHATGQAAAADATDSLPTGDDVGGSRWSQASRRQVMGGMLAAVVGGGASSLATNMAWASAAWADEAEAEVEVGVGGVAGAGDGGVDGGAFDADATADVAADEVVMPAPPSNEEPPAPTSAPAKPKAAPAVRYKGTNWSVVVPGSYARMGTTKPRRIYEAKAGLDCEPYCRDLQSKRTEESPLVARFGSEEQQADISVSIRGANTLKLTFLQIKDVTEFGEVAEAAPLFLPPGSKLLSATARTEPQLNTAGDAIDKSYYTYDFEFGYVRVLLTAAVENGNVVLLGATARAAAWADSESGFRRAAASFKVGAEPTPKPVAASPSTEEGAQAGAAGGGATSVDITPKVKKPTEGMDCKLPPIFCIRTD